MMLLILLCVVFSSRDLCFEMFLCVVLLNLCVVFGLRLVSLWYGCFVGLCTLLLVLLLLSLF